MTGRGACRGARGSLGPERFVEDLATAAPLVEPDLRVAAVAGEQRVAVVLVGELAALRTGRGQPVRPRPAQSNGRGWPVHPRWWDARRQGSVGRYHGFCWLRSRRRRTGRWLPGTR